VSELEAADDGRKRKLTPNGGKEYDASNSEPHFYFCLKSAAPASEFERYAIV
jgi:hypothetical protein